jgi:hypothetical protein
MTAGTQINLCVHFMYDRLNRHMQLPSTFEYLPPGLLVWLVENHILSNHNAMVH